MCRITVENQHEKEQALYFHPDMDDYYSDLKATRPECESYLIHCSDLDRDLFIAEDRDDYMSCLHTITRLWLCPKAISPEGKILHPDMKLLHCLKQLKVEIYDSDVELLPDWDSLIFLNIRGTKITKVPAEYTNLRSLNLYENETIRELPETLVSLRNLDISRSEIKYLPKNLPALETLHSYFGELKRMEPTWTNLEAVTITELNLENDFMPEYPKMFQAQYSGVCCRKKKYGREESTKSKYTRSIGLF
jgi:hypothetical protein